MSEKISKLEDYSKKLKHNFFQQTEILEERATRTGMKIEC